MQNIDGDEATRIGYLSMRDRSIGVNLIKYIAYFNLRLFYLRDHTTS